MKKVVLLDFLLANVTKLSTRAVDSLKQVAIFRSNDGSWHKFESK